MLQGVPDRRPSSADRVQVRQTIHRDTKWPGLGVASPRGNQWSVLDLFPRVVRVVFVHSRAEKLRIRPKIVLKDRAVVADKQGHDSGRSVVSRVSIELDSPA